MFGPMGTDGDRWADGWMAEVEQQARQARELADRVAAVTVTATDPADEVRVTVAASGAVTDLWLHDDVRSRPADEIASLVLDTMRQAQSQLAAEVAELTAETVGAGSETGRALVDSYAERFPEQRRGGHGHGDQEVTGRSGYGGGHDGHRGW